MRVPGASRRRRGAGSDRRGRFARSAPALLLLLSLAVAGLGAVQAYQAQRSHRATADALLTDYGAFVAWSYTDQWAGRLDAGLSATLNTVRGAMAAGVATRDCLEVLLAPGAEQCGCGPPLTGPASWAFRATYSGGEPAIESAGPAPSAPELARLMAEVVAHARARYRAGQSHAVFRVSPDSARPTRVLGYALVPSVVPDTVVYGVEIDPAQLVRLSDDVLDRAELLPPSLSRGRPNRELVAVTLTASDGEVLFRSAAGDALTHPAEQRVSATLGGGLVHASVLPEVADQLIIGGLPRNRLPLLLAVLALSGGLALVAVRQLGRENQLARMRSDFVASVSHELRSPLAQVRLFVDTLRLGRAPTEEHRRWALANIDREVLRLAGLVENVLAFSRAERGRLSDLGVEPADIGTEVSAVVAAFELLAPPGRVRLELSARSGVQALIHTDSFRQVLLNLLDNAVKYGPCGQTVRVTADARADRVRIAVEDEGPGVPAEEREAVFEPFRRGRTVLDGAVAGSGIGLSVVRDIVRAHEGRAWVEEAPAGGARFVVELPRLDASGAGRTPERAAQPETAEALASRGGTPRAAEEGTPPDQAEVA